MEGPGREGRELQVGTIDVAVEEHYAREVDGTVIAEDLVFIQFEVDAETLDDFRIRAGFDFETNGVSLAAVVQFDANGFEQGARLFFFEVEVGISGDAERYAGEHFVSAIHAGEVLRDQVLEEEVVEFAVLGGEADKPGKGPGHCDYAEDLRAGALPFAPQQQGEAERLVEDARKGVGGVDGDGGQEGIDLALEVALGIGAGVFVQFVPLKEADALFAQLGKQEIVPAAILGIDKAVDFGGESGERFVRAQAIVALFAIAVFNALHEAGLADFDIFIEIGTGDGQKLHSLEERIRRVFCFFEDAPIELHPGMVATCKKL